MRLQKYLVGFILSLLVVGGSIYWFSYKSVEAPSDLVEARGPRAISEEARKISMRETFESFDQNLLCKVTSIDNSNGAFTGTVYISDSSILGEFDVQQAGKLFAANILLQADNQYFWMDTPQGKVGFKADPESKDLDSDFPINIEQPVDYECDTWTPEADKFVLPSDIDFS